jgi:hypothetical protein
VNIVAMPPLGILTAQERRVHLAPGVALPGSTLTGGLLGRRKYSCPLPECNLVVEVPLQEWVVPTLDSLQRLLALQNGWDSYGARAINRANIATAIELVTTLMHDRTPPPSVVPTSAGGVQLEWHTRGIDLEIEICSPSRISASFEDHRSEREWDLEQVFNFGLLRDALREMAQRKP